MHAADAGANGRTRTAYNLIVFSDEIYDKLILDGTPHIAFRFGRARCSVRDLRWYVEELSWFPDGALDGASFPVTPPR